MRSMGRGTIRRMVEGEAPLLNSGDDRLRTIYRVAHRDTHRLDTARRQPKVANAITRGSIAQVMRRTIDFDRQSGLRTIEVQHIRADRMLASDPDAARP